MTHIYRDNYVIPIYSHADIKHNVLPMAGWFCFDMSLADAKTSSLIISTEGLALVFISVSLSGSKTLARHHHGNRESPTRCQGNQSENMIFFFFFFSDKVQVSFSAMLLRF